MGENRLRPRHRRRIRQITLGLGFCLVVYCLIFLFNDPTTTSNGKKLLFPLRSSSKHLTPELLENLSLTEDQCNAAFPGLTKEIDDTVAQGPFRVKQSGDLGPLQGRIKDGKIFIIYAQRKADISKEMLNSRTAALHQLHRAILTSPSSIPNTIFNLNFQDQPFGTAWAYSKAADPQLRPKDPDARSFLMPHFSFWAWKLPFIGSISRAASAITALEAEYSGKWHTKISKAVWRGTSWFNSVHSPRLRHELVRTAKGRDWADVQTLEWTGGGIDKAKNASNALKIEDFCRYKYVIHTEGVTYSGRFQFLQMCKSVVLTPPIQWMQHTTHLVRPVWSSSLDLETTKSWKRREKEKAKAVGDGSSGSGTKKSPGSWMPTERMKKTWPVQYPPEEANIVFVAKDWSDLEDTVAWLEEHPDVAEGIARRQRELFFDGGYFSPAAEACYWRALVRGWAKVANTEGEGWEELEGTTYEAFSLSLDNGA